MGLRLLVVASIAVTAMLWVYQPGSYPVTSETLHVEDPVSAPHFILRQKARMVGHNIGAIRVELTVYFEAPDSWRIVQREGPQVTERIRVGDRAWKRSSGGPWQPIEPELVSAGALPFAPGFLTSDDGQDRLDLTRGPRIGEELTTRVLYVEPNMGQIMNDAFDRVAAENPIPAENVQSIHELQRDSSAIIHSYFGRDSNRILLLVIHWQGPGIDSHQSILYDYETPVRIEAPR